RWRSRSATGSRSSRPAVFAPRARWPSCAGTPPAAGPAWRTSSSSSPARTRRASWWTCSMPETATAALGARPDPSLFHVLWPKYLTARARSVSDERGRGARFAILGVFGFLFWAFIFGVLQRLLAYFRGVPEIGPLL